MCSDCDIRNLGWDARSDTSNSDNEVYTSKQPRNHLPKAVLERANVVAALRHNDPIAATVHQTLSDLEEEAERNLARNRKLREKLAVQIKRLQIRKDVLHVEDEQCKTTLRLCQTLRAPIRRLPIDVLREIGGYCVPSPTDKQRRTPVIFSHVCYAWRSAALSAPRMWTTLHMNLKDIWRGKMGKYSTLVKEWFRRSGKLPLSLFIELNDWTADRKRPLCMDSDSPMHKLLESLAPFLSRLSHFSIKSADGHWFRKIDLQSLFQARPLSFNSAINLRLLNLQFNISPSPVVDESVRRPLPYTPALTHLIVHSELVRSPVLRRHLPWAQLTHLQVLPNLALPAWTAIMALCPKLQTGIFALHDDSATHFPMPLCPVTHVDLKHLRLELLTISVQYGALHVLSSFHLPGLVDLDVSHKVNSLRGTPHGNARRNQLDFDATTLERLSFSDISDHYVSDLINNYYNLRELSVDTQEFPSSLINALTHSPAPADKDSIIVGCLPHLSAFNLIHRGTHTKQHTKAIKSMIASRNPNKRLPMAGLRQCSGLAEVTISVQSSSVPAVKKNITPSPKVTFNVTELQESSTKYVSLLQ